jgi:AcrR family transcriptional regulator
MDKKKQILLAAQKCFLKKGFAGTSISNIADCAEIPKALIYHYFKNKEDLWQEVKLNILNSYFNEDILENAPHENLIDFVRFVVEKRMDLYANNPELSKMIHWQALEEKGGQALEEKGEEKKELTTSPNSKIMVPWLSIVQDFQKRNIIKQDLDPTLVLLMLTQSASAPYITTPYPFGEAEDEIKRKKYQEMLIQVLYLGLAV